MNENRNSIRADYHEDEGVLAEHREARPSRRVDDESCRLREHTRLNVVVAEDQITTHAIMQLAAI